MSNKPVVTFSGHVDFRQAINTETGERREYAIVYGPLDHPKLGHMGFREYVITSLIETKCEDGSAFETQNTIYRKASDEPADRAV